MQPSGMHPSFSMIMACHLRAPRMSFIVIQVKEAVCDSDLCRRLTHTSSHKYEDHLSCPKLGHDQVDHMLNFNDRIATHCEGNLRLVAQLNGMSHTSTS